MTKAYLFKIDDCLFIRTFTSFEDLKTYIGGSLKAIPPILRMVNTRSARAQSKWNAPKRIRLQLDEMADMSDMIKVQTWLRDSDDTFEHGPGNMMYL